MKHSHLNNDELNKLYLNRVAIGGFANSIYWSSSEFGFEDAWWQNFSSGIQIFNAKSNGYAVRAVRAF